MDDTDAVADIPPPPAGGSWRFDEFEWKWLPNSTPIEMPTENED